MPLLLQDLGEGGEGTRHVTVVHLALSENRPRQNQSHFWENHSRMQNWRFRKTRGAYLVYHLQSFTYWFFRGGDPSVNQSTNQWGTGPWACLIMIQRPRIDDYKTSHNYNRWFLWEYHNSHMLIRKWWFSGASRGLPTSSRQTRIIMLVLLYIPFHDHQIIPIVHS